LGNVTLLKNKFMDGAILIQQALQLDFTERIHLIDVLWHSLDSSDREEIDLAWLRESQSRLTAYQSGQIEAIDGQNVFAEIEALL
jgi:putative addiction module component (TIGR02574 family)